MEVTQEKPKQPEGWGKQEVVTQEPTSLQLHVEATTENQEAATKTWEDAKIGTQEYVVTQEPTSSWMDFEVDRKGFQEEDVVTQESTSPKLIVEVPLQA